MKSLTALGATGIAAFTMASTALAVPAQRVTAESLVDRQFLIQTAEENVGGTNIAELLSERATNPQVKQYGQTLAREHQNMSRELQQLASKMDIDLPQEAGAASEEVEEQLTNLSGPEFDRVALQVMIQDHEADIQNFERIAKSTKDQEIKQFAQNSVGKMRQHLNKAQQLSRQVGQSGSGNQQAMNLDRSSENVSGSTSQTQRSRSQGPMNESEDQDIM